MKRLIMAVAVTAAASMLLAYHPAGAADHTNGLADVSLASCAKDESQSDAYVPGCSYLFLTKAAAPSYTYISSHGSVSWNFGMLTNGLLSFPASGQTWPALNNIYLGGSVTITPSLISGAVDAQGKVELTLRYDVLLQNGQRQCRLTGTTALSSQGTEALGGQATGRNYDPTTGQFAVVSTTYPPPEQSGACLLTAANYDLARGMGWYLTGTMTLPTTPVVQKQAATVAVPKRIAREGKTVLLPRPVVTNAGKTAVAKVTWSTKTKGPKKKFASVRTSKKGKVTITTTGKAKKLRVRLRLKAPATPGYGPYTLTKTWTVK